MSKVKNVIHTFDKCFKGGGLFGFFDKIGEELERARDDVKDEFARATGNTTSNDRERAEKQMKKLKQQQAEQKKEKAQSKEERGRAALEDEKAKRFTKKKKGEGGGKLVTGAGMETGLAPQDQMGKDKKIDQTSTYKMTKKKKDNS